MAGYSIIAEFTDYLTGLLRKNLCPDIIPQPLEIRSASPAEGDGDYTVGLHLYDMKEDTQIQPPQMSRSGGNELMPPPRIYSLHYLIYLNETSAGGGDARKQQEVIGRTAQCLNDYNTVSPMELQADFIQDEPPIMLSQPDITLEEKAGIWQALHKPYRLSLFYRAAPVFISSRIMEETFRVAEASFNVSVYKGEKEGEEL